MSKIAIIMPKWIGDYIMVLSVVEERRKQFNEDITLLTVPYLIELAQTLTTMEIAPYRTEEGLQQAKVARYTDIYIIPHSISSAHWAYSTGVKNRHGYKKEGRSPLITHRHSIVNKNRTKHITTEYSDLLGISELDLDAVKGVSLGGEKTDTIILCPGAKYGPAKQWPHFSHFITAHPKEDFIILGGEDEFPYAELLVKENPDISVKNFCGKVSLSKAAKILSTSKIVISNDSGLMHLAAYVKASVIGIFGSSTPNWTRPLGNRSKIIWRNEPCSPCFKRECPYSHYHCLDKISVEEVSSLMQSILS